jgi:hypothetical protein
MTSLRTHLPRRPLFRALLLAGAAVAGSLAVIGTPADTPAEASDDDPWILPVPPEHCTEEQVDSGDVAGCTVVFYDDPSETGWGVPPAPGVGDGWEWSGYRYNGSPVLADWEDEQIVANTEPVAGFRAGTLETHKYAQVLFEGFLNEITERGYDVRDVSGYGFRCTAGSGGWECPGGDPDDLSNHAWGLAIDMNSMTNPITSYQGVDGQTACRTPIETDMPRWMIQTAEKWGLYWGGYGWNSGCQSLDTPRVVVSRDPPHFEFRGTPEQAAAIAAFNLGNDPLAVCRTIVDESGETVEHCSRSERPAAGMRLSVDLDPPEGAVAAMINLTATGADGPGYLTLEDCAARDGERDTSAITFTAGQSVAAMAIVPLDDTGRFCVYRSTAVHSIVDLAAYLGADGEPLRFSPEQPERLTDSRVDGACLPEQECRPGTVPAGATHTVPTADGDARIVNLTVVDARSPSYAQVGRCIDVGPGSDFSNLNVMDAGARANLALVPASDDGTCAYTLSEANVIVDELGRLAPDGLLGWTLAPSRRVLDTRECTDQWCDGRPEGETVIRVGLDTDAPVAAIAITVTDARAAGYVTVGRCDVIEDGGGARTSNVNVATAGATATGLALVELDAGEMCAYTRSPAHVIIDVQAELTADSTVGVAPVDPARVHDSRDRELPAGTDG